jgi:DNA-binding NtrC family response regulator
VPRQVLIVEDEQGIRDILVELFDVEENAVDAAGLLDDAKGKLAQRMYDLIVTDIRLGGKRDGGLQVMAASGLLSPDATVIVLTAYPDPDNRHASLRLGATHFLEKPVDLGTIAALAAQAGVSSALIPVAARRLGVDDTASVSTFPGFS